MNITKRHNLSIVVNGEQLDVESQDKINLRINNTVYNPEKVSVTQSEYSFSFNVPQTPRNNRIFGFANIPSVKGKFVRQYNTYVYADNVEIFNGLLRISSISDGNYKCNLISVKNSSIDEIFGEKKMNEIKWDVPYLGASTQNAVNEQDDPDYFYPLVCYGAFQKIPYNTSIYTSDDEITKQYTSTNQIDLTTQIWEDTFVPSPKLIEVVKRMIEQSGYQWSGDVFNDDLITKLYLSSSIASDQDPLYNLGSDIGRIKIDYDFRTKVEWYEGSNIWFDAEHSERDLKYPELPKLKGNNPYISIKEPNDPARIYNVWKNESSTWEGILAPKTVFAKTKANNDRMWQDGMFIAPTSGLYRIKMNGTLTMNGTDRTAIRNDVKYVPYQIFGGRFDFTNDSVEKTFDNLTYELQLVKNGDEELEFIATESDNWLVHNPTDYATMNTLGDYPHESYSGKKGIEGLAIDINLGFDTSWYKQYWAKTRGYDPIVDPNFIMGFSTASRGWGIQKRGKSYNALSPTFHYNNYRCDGYQLNYKNGQTGVVTKTNTDYQKWNDAHIPESVVRKWSGKEYEGTGYALIWLEKNDTLEMKLLTKDWRNYKNNGAPTGDNEYDYEQIFHDVSVKGYVEIEAFSPSRKDLTRNYYAQSVFGQNLNLGNFLNKEEAQKDFFNNFLTTFNLSCNIEGGTMTINKNVMGNKTSECVELDDRVNIDEAEHEVIDFPTSLQVKWTIADDESGFYHSVGEDHINDDNWKDWADIGSEKIEFMENGFKNNDISKTSKFSYNWMMPFTLSYLWSQGADGKWTTNLLATKTVMLPIIAKDENFIDGADYEEMMQKDGRSLKQRLWFKGDLLDEYIPSQNGATAENSILATGDDFKEWMRVCLPTNLYNGQDVLKFTNEEGSILRRYFNVNQDTDSNYTTIEAYLTPQEYIRIKNGAMVRFDNDRYQICSITGYDPSGGNKTKLKLMKL